MSGARALSHRLDSRAGHALGGRHVIYHSLADARTVLEVGAALGVAVTLRTAPDAVGYAGAAYLRKIFDIARREYADTSAAAMLDCGDNGAAALNAIRTGWTGILFTGRRPVRERVRAVAARHRVVYLDRRVPALDPRSCADPAAACREWLAAGKPLASAP